MLLVLNRTCSYSNIQEQVVKVSVVFRVQHLIGAGKTGLGQRLEVQFANRNETLEEVRTIQEEGKVKRAEAEAELGRIEGELKQKLLEFKQ